jgi:hypothetical protein
MERNSIDYFGAISKSIQDNDATPHPGRIHLLYSMMLPLSAVKSVKSHRCMPD